MPIEASLVAPFTPLRYLTAHKQKLLAGMRPHVCVERAKVRKLLLARAVHLVEHRALHVDDFVVREGEYVVLAPSVGQPEGEVVMEVSAHERVALKVFERVVHPTHVPLEIEAEPVLVCPLCDERPAC